MCKNSVVESDEVYYMCRELVAMGGPLYWGDELSSLTLVMGSEKGE